MKRANRLNYKEILNEYARIGKKNVRLAPSSLFLTQFIDPAKAVYTFDTLDSQNTGLQPDEIRININDEFICTHMGVYLYGKATQLPVAPVPVTCPMLFSYAPFEMNLGSVRQDGLYAGQMKIGVN